MPSAEDVAKPAGSVVTTELLEDAIESIDEGFMLFDAEDRLVARNTRYLELYGVTEADYPIGTLWSDLLRNNIARGRYPEAIGREGAFVAEREQHRCSPGAIYEILLHNGRWLRATDRRTREGGMVSIRADITDQKRAAEQLRALEQAARESETRLRRIFDANPLPMTITRMADGKVLYANERVAEMLKVPLAELVGSSMARFFVDPGDRATILSALRGEDCTELLEMQFRRSDGSRFPLSGISRELEYLGERCIVTGLHDMTEWRRMEGALHQNEKLAALGSLLAGVAHELNNPLAVVLAQSTLMKEKAADPATVTRAGKIHGAALRCARIVRSFLAIARQRPPSYADIDVLDVVGASVELTSYSLRSAGIALEVDVPAGLRALGDADQIGQVLMNLIVNGHQALSATTGERRIRIAAGRLDPSRVTIVVSDNGPGIPDHIESRIFDPFFTTKDVGVGTGIGLSICLGIITAHGGSITHESVSGGGAAFRIVLPSAGTAGPRIEDEPAGSTFERAAKSILIVEDEPDLAQILAEIVQPLVQRVDIAENGLDALRLAASTRYDLIVSDVRMPDLDGPRLVERLRESRTFEGQILFVTGDTLHHHLETALAGYTMIEKPFDPLEVETVVGTLLREGRGRPDAFGPAKTRP